MKKFIRLISICLTGMFILFGCVSKAEKDAMTPTQFKTKMEEKGYTVLNQTEQAKDDSYQ